MTPGERVPLLVIGVGNAWRHDDGAGPAVAERLAGRATTLILPGEGTELLDAWRGADRVIVVDAMRSGAPVGTIRRFDAIEAPLPAQSFPHLSHSFGLPEAVEMGRLLGGLPRELTVFGIEAGDLSFGRGLGAEVADAVGRLAGEIMER